MNFSDGWPFYLALGILFVLFPWSFTTLVSRYRRRIGCLLDQAWILWTVHVIMALLTGGALFIVVSTFKGSADDPLFVAAQALWVSTLSVFAIGLHFSIGQAYWVFGMLLLLLSILLYTATTVVQAMLEVDSLLGNLPFLAYTIYCLVSVVRLYRKFKNYIPRVRVARQDEVDADRQGSNGVMSRVYKNNTVLDQLMPYVPESKVQYISPCAVSEASGYEKAPDFEELGDEEEETREVLIHTYNI